MIKIRELLIQIWKLINLLFQMFIKVANLFLRVKLQKLKIMIFPLLITGLLLDIDFEASSQGIKFVNTSTNNVYFAISFLIAFVAIIFIDFIHLNGNRRERMHLYTLIILPDIDQQTRDILRNRLDELD
jgi:cell shape-determining protein MreC